MPEDRSWLNHFDAFSAFHWTTLAVCIAIITGWCVVGRALRARDASDAGDRERRFRHALAWAFIAWQAFATAWRLLPMNFDINESIPLHLCRIVGWVAPIAMLTLHWRWRAVVFFWGIGLSTQGFFTPMWHDGLASVAFWLYWVGHVIIIGSGVYDLAVLGYRPRLRHLGFASVAGVGLTVGIAAFNVACGTNYCYLGKGDYEGTSIVDHLGDWPARPAIIIGGSVFVFVVLYLIARGIERLAGGRATPEATPA
ncbi:MAG: TIGR02206 family membrane protein [Phycisphaerales bacterium]